ncbi:hypothetical protein AB4Y30_01490 [Ornithinibacillus sp. 4-3]|uniref:YqbF C-terminal domain-containing protein n=1 Tax=Ornithinibacillus sp. 4-3 TaxID=3231488 RepID=A0AB39HRY2_9BACI
MSIKLKLVKTLSYSGIVSANHKQPYVTVEDQMIAMKAVSTGYFEIVKEPVSDESTGQVDNKEEPETPKHTKSSIKKLSADEQRALIEELGGDPDKTNNEEERIELILASQGE